MANRSSQTNQSLESAALQIIAEHIKQASMRSTVLALLCAGSGAVCFKVHDINYQLIRNTGHNGQSGKYLVEYAKPAPMDEAFVDHLIGFSPWAHHANVSQIKSLMPALFQHT
jgi:hypothetical protein